MSNISLWLKKHFSRPMKMKESFSKKKENAAHQRGKISIYLSSKEYYTGWLDTQTQTHRVTSAESTSAANRHKPRRHHFKVFLPHSSVSRQLVDLIGRWNSLARPIKQVGMFPLLLSQSDRNLFRNTKEVRDNSTDTKELNVQVKRFFLRHHSQPKRK